MSLWTPNDYANIITIGASAIGSVMLILFKSRCRKISKEEEEKIKETDSAPPNP